MASDNKNLESQRREENGVVYFDRGMLEGRNGKGEPLKSNVEFLKKKTERMLRF